MYASKLLGVHEACGMSGILLILINVAIKLIVL